MPHIADAPGTGVGGILLLDYREQESTESVKCVKLQEAGTFQKPATIIRTSGEKDMDNTRLDQLFDFLREKDKEKFIGRLSYLSDGIRKENDAEHAWHLALMAFLLSEYANAPIDVLRTMTMLLIHDVVEIDAGDTYAYDEAEKNTQRQRELAAADRIFRLLPKDQGERLRALWDEFEESATPEAKFAHAMDNLQPMMLNDASDGLSWSEHGVCLNQILNRNAHTPDGSETLWEYAKEQFLMPNVEKGRIKA